ncbi:MAG TPA: aldo/keto reductase [Fimbriimonadaceae bacterium]|nr:aldo/keto reductase [Fimbriimonadaceae bacterium]
MSVDRERDGIDPGSVPGVRLASGASIPAIGIGTFGSDKYGPKEIGNAVLGALEVGYRHIDCASVYGNEREVGDAVRLATLGGIPRRELWLTSKLWNDEHAPSKVRVACERSLSHLGTDYLDLYLIHWPFPNFHPPHCDVSARSPDAKPYIHEAYMETWQELEKLVVRGLVRHIGSSNMTAPKLKLLLRDAKIKPAANEMELHPHFQQPELFDFVVANGIAPIAYSPLGSPSRPERDRTPDDSVDMADPVLLEIAARADLTPAAVCIRWGIQRGHVVIPFSVKRNQYLDSLRAAVAPPLPERDMRALAGIDRNCRLIKGQVFLWREDQSWEELWDVDGVIAT